MWRFYKQVVAKVKIPEGAKTMRNGEERFEVCKAFADYRLEGKMEGKTEGKVESVLELLEDYGEIPEELKERIYGEKDMAVIKRWHKAAAKANSIEEFQNAM